MKYANQRNPGNLPFNIVEMNGEILLLAENSATIMK